MTDIVLHDPATYAHGFPYEYFRELRASRPVTEHPLPNGGTFWAVARHADVQRVSRDSETFSNAPNPFIENEGQIDDGSTSELLISKDAPEHIKLRKLINRGLHPQARGRSDRPAARPQ